MVIKYSHAGLEDDDLKELDKDFEAEDSDINTDEDENDKFEVTGDFFSYFSNPVFR